MWAYVKSGLGMFGRTTRAAFVEGAKDGLADEASERLNDALDRYLEARNRDRGRGASRDIDDPVVREAFRLVLAEMHRPLLEDLAELHRRQAAAAAKIEMGLKGLVVAGIAYLIWRRL